MMTTDPLQKREVFHLVFLRALGRSAPLSTFAVKGGCNLRFFFGGVRYSEDIDLDSSGVPVHALRERVMTILASSGLLDTLRTFGIDRVQAPDISRAKQTETVQRFKVHLITTAGEDLPTKIDFSRRGFDAPIRSEPVSMSIVAAYRLAPIVAPHYAALPAAAQKVQALIARGAPQARDVFDLYTLGSQPEINPTALRARFRERDLRQAHDRIYEIEYAQYRDTVLSFLAPEDRATYGSSEIWDEIRLRVAALIGHPVKQDE
ncbi:MAG: nucleotidyl transferase AbiEii/AbiGii toxin family protein [Bacillati bacterium ANGP1]|uniref:Nucleotidyl transferase AbiEii/AbiGii toxin family protein n=1 Tax=Candidatus Segetimicrobium genomatis TaxID=2569760 RepID=A0A537K1H6_9BACT|nr:MAG: nucleotidyl transferase AbiEii/AbiGii toxin family protein [Terrabacteria group bacterium ANGP1]